MNTTQCSVYFCTCETVMKSWCFRVGDLAVFLFSVKLNRLLLLRRHQRERKMPLPALRTSECLFPARYLGYSSNLDVEQEMSLQSFTSSRCLHRNSTSSCALSSQSFSANGINIVSDLLARGLQSMSGAKRIGTLSFKVQHCCVLAFQRKRGSRGEKWRPQRDDPRRVESHAGQGAHQGGVQHPQAQRRSRQPVEERIRAPQVQERRREWGAVKCLNQLLFLYIHIQACSPTCSTKEKRKALLQQLSQPFGSEVELCWLFVSSAITV